MLTVYAYEKCSTCRTALAWLTARGIAHRVVAIRDQPPTVAELERMLAAHGGEVKALCNRSGVDYRALGLKDRLPTMTTTAALRLLAGNGNLVKRPFVLGPKAALIGFDAEVWATALG